MDIVTRPFVFAANSTVSDVLGIGDKHILRIRFPPAWTTAAMSFAIGPSSGSLASLLHDHIATDNLTEYVKVLSVGNQTLGNLEALVHSEDRPIFGPFVQLISGLPLSPVLQTAGGTGFITLMPLSGGF